MTDLDRNPAYWQRHARRYDRGLAVLNRRFGQVAALVAEEARGRDHVLELAAGTGLLTVALAPAVGHLLATDRSPEMLAFLRRRLCEAGHDRVEVQVADATATGLPGASFDVVVMANLLHLLPDPGLALEEARRVLKPGGRLLAPTFCHGETLVAQIVSRILGLSGFPVEKRFGGPDLRHLVAAHGFAVEREEVVPGLLPIRYLRATRA